LPKSEPAPFPKVDAKLIRRTGRKLGCSRAVFARQLRINLRTLEKWEQGRAKPNPPMPQPWCSSSANIPTRSSALSMSRIVPTGRGQRFADLWGRGTAKLRNPFKAWDVKWVQPPIIEFFANFPHGSGQELDGSAPNITHL
jgi:hypothetical protein